MVNYLRTHGNNPQFILVEDDTQPNTELAKSLQTLFTEPDIHNFLTNKMDYRRPLAYNIGANLTERRVLCFLDTDIIVHPASIEMTKNCLLDGTFDVMWPYNGTAMFMTELGRSCFISDPRIDNLLQFRPKSNVLFSANPYMRVEHNKAKGAISMQRRESFETTGGFNIDFIGWGYEDDEFEYRMRVLNQKLGRCLGEHEVFYHLYHPRSQANASVNPNHPFLDHNIGLLQSIQNASPEQVQEWMNTQKTMIRRYFQ